MNEADTPFDAAQRRKEISEEIQRLAQEFIQTLEGYERGVVTAYHMPCEVLVPGNHRVLFEIGDNQSSRHTAMGLLFASLNDPRWLDPDRE